MEIVKEPESTYQLVKIPNIEFEPIEIHNSKEISGYIRPKYNGSIEIFESFFIVAINRSNKIIGHMKISQGGISATVVDIKLVCHYAINMLASAIILIHNHPSGKLKPSQADINLTNKVKQALTIFDINLLDHIIVGADKHYSFADEGIL